MVSDGARKIQDGVVTPSVARTRVLRRGSGVPVPRALRAATAHVARHLSFCLSLRLACAPWHSFASSYSGLLPPFSSVFVFLSPSSSALPFRSVTRLADKRPTRPKGAGDGGGSRVLHPCFGPEGPTPAAPASGAPQRPPRPQRQGREAWAFR